MNNFDLNIENYKYDELLNLFKISTPDDKYKIDKYVSEIKQSVSNEIYSFFYKSKVILNTIFNLLENNVIKTDTEINEYVETIKNIKNLETYSDIEIYNKIIPILNTPPIPALNIPYYNVNKLDPSLNNKNNTNIIYNTDINEISPGNLNSVKRITQLFNLNINSCFRNNYYQSNPCDFLYIIPSEIKNVVAMRLVSIEIPNSWYLFSNVKKNNIFQIIINTKNNNYDANYDKSYVYDIEIIEGNYTNETLQDYLNSTYFYESGLDNYLKYIKFTINPYNLKTTFEIINNDCLQLSFTLKFSQNINQNIMNTFGWLIGFRLGNYLNITDKITSEGLFDAGGDRYIYVCINDFQYNKNTTNMVCFDKSILNEDVLAKIPMMNGKLSLIINDNYAPLTQLRRYNGPINLSRLQIKIVDHFGSVIDLNNMDFSITLELQILYESFNFSNITA
jgi:hypothetical protein